MSSRTTAKLLVVDDATFIRDLVKRVLRTRMPNVQVEEAINGKRAIQILHKQQIDLVLCDWEMPEMSGLEVLQWMRAQDAYQKTPFIMITSRTDKEYVVQAVQAGASDYIGKPFSNEQLLQKAGKQLAKTHDLRALAARDTSNPVAEAAASSVNPLLAGASRTGSGTAGPAAESVSLLTGGGAKPARAAAPAAESASILTGAANNAKGVKAAANKSASAAASATKGVAQLRLSDATVRCIIKDLNLQEALLVIKNDGRIPQVLEQAVVDIEAEEGGQQVARVNAFVFSVQANERRVDSPFISLRVQFVDNDPEKFEALTHYVTRIR